MGVLELAGTLKARIYAVRAVCDRSPIRSRQVTVRGRRGEPQPRAQFGVQRFASAPQEDVRALSRPWPMRSPPIAEPRTALFHKLLHDPQIQQVAFARYSLPVQDVHFGFAERRGHLVLHDLDLGAVPDRLSRRPLMAAMRRTSTRTEE